MTELVSYLNEMERKKRSKSVDKAKNLLYSWSTGYPFDPSLISFGKNMWIEKQAKEDEEYTRWEGNIRFGKTYDELWQLGLNYV